MLRLSRKSMLALEAVIDIAYSARAEPVQARGMQAQVADLGIVDSVVHLHRVMIHLSATVRANQFGFRHALGLLVL